MATVVAFIVKGEHGYGVSFPDFPGALTGGETVGEALARARDTLDAHVDALLEAGFPLPRLRSFEEVELDDETDLVAAVEVDLPGKAVRVNVSFDERLLERIDRAAKATGESRSAFLASAAKSRLANAS